MTSEHKTQIIIAIIGLVGTVAVGLLSNWDKLQSVENLDSINDNPSTVMPSGSSNVDVSNQDVTSTIQSGYIPRQFDGRIGRVSINNTTLYDFTITLWHPDTQSRFSSWVVPGKTKKYLEVNEERISVGNDWGIQIGDSEIKSIGDASDWRASEWHVNQNNFYR